MIYKRGKYFWYDFRVATIRHRGSTGLVNKRKAQEFADDLKARRKREAKGLEVTITNDHKIYAAVEEYLVYSATQFRPSTVSHKRKVWDVLKRCISDGPLHTISARHVDEIEKYGIAHHWLNSSTNNYVDQLRAFVKWAKKKKKYLQVNPLEDVERLPVPEPVDKVIDEDDLKKLLAVCPAYLREIIWVDWQTGIRLSNVVKLRYDQIDYDHRSIDFTPAEMKKGKRVLIDLEPRVAEWFRARRQAHPDDTYVWPSPVCGYDHYSPHYVTSRFTKYARQIGLSCTFHSIRHTFATNWVKAGVSLFHVGKFLSHKSIQSTQRYVHAEDLISQRDAKKRVGQQQEVPALALS